MDQEKLTQPVIRGAATKLAICGTATFLWLIVAVYLGYHAHPPMDDTKCVGTFACLTASEWGDFLAGVFAPVAFFWLVVTVWIQSDELREQRVELALTRREFELNRKVLEGQVKEAERQATHIETQTKLLMDEANLRRRDANLTSFSALIRRYIEHTRESRNELYFRTGSSSGEVIVNVASHDVSSEKYVFFQSERLKSIIGASEDSINIFGAELFENSYMFIYGAEELLNDIPYHSRVSWKRSEIATLLDNYGVLITRSPELSHLLHYVAARERRLAHTDTRQDH